MPITEDFQHFLAAVKRQFLGDLYGQTNATPH
jgi:hypothetical protein